jgi:hypothetical protein
VQGSCFMVATNCNYIMKLGSPTQDTNKIKLMFLKNGEYLSPASFRANRAL